MRTTGALAAAFIFLASGCGGASRREVQTLERRVASIEAGLKSSEEGGEQIARRIDQLDEGQKGLRADADARYRASSLDLARKIEAAHKDLEDKLSLLEREVRELAAARSAVPPAEKKAGEAPPGK